MATSALAYPRVLRIILRGILILAMVVSGFAVLPAQGAAAAGAANDHTVLVLGPTVTGGASSIEAAAAAAAGMTIEVVDNAGWAAKSAADFASYRALIIGDRTCSSLPTAAAAQANAMVWGPTINGRVIINGTDPVYHASQGGSAFTTGAVRFVVGEVGKTSAYISLSCYYHGTVPHTPVPLLAGLGGFTVTGVGCFNNAHIVATHPALTGITDATLSNWSCSVHEAFDAWPVADFQVLAVARNFGSAFTASDGTVGTPYILARGVSVISDITLTPGTGGAAVGTSYTLTATVVKSGLPLSGRAVTFSVIAGPNTGVTITGTTNASGVATATYTSTLTGIDAWVARFVDDSELTQTSNTAKVSWTAGTTPTTPTGALLVANSTACGTVTLKATGVTPGLTHQFVVSNPSAFTANVTDVTADASQTVALTLDVAKALGVSGGTFSAFLRMKSNGVTMSNTVTFAVAACPTPAPTATPTATPAATAAPTPTPTPTPTPIARLPSTSSDGSDGLGALALAALAFALVSIVSIGLAKRAARS